MSLFGVACECVATAAFAHAHLRHSAPAAGAILKDAPSELRLDFSEGVEAKLSKVGLTDGMETAVPTEAPASDPVDKANLVVKIERPLSAGAYTVAWRVVATDSHKTSGSFTFTVKP